MVYSAKWTDEIKQARKSRKRLAFGAELIFSIGRSVSTSTITGLAEKDKFVVLCALTRA